MNSPVDDLGPEVRSCLEELHKAELQFFREQHEAGDPYALVKALYLVAKATTEGMSAALPEWLAKDLGEALGKLLNLEAPSMDEAFGWRRVKRRPEKRRQQSNMFRVFREVELRRQGLRSGDDNLRGGAELAAIFEEVAGDLELTSASMASKYYYHVKKELPEDIQRFLLRPDLRIPEDFRI
jgi:hypothetical protein